jgi:DNA replication and repair protein RecF
LNLFSGPNGAGKTAILEALHVVVRGRSFRSSSLSRIVHHEADSMWVRVVLEDTSLGSVSVGIQRQRHGPLEVRVNGQNAKPSSVAEMVPLQVMLPDASDLVFGAPGERREFLDWGVFHVEHQHLQCLRDYRRALRQRNRLLREAHGEPNALTSAVDSWTDRLLVLGADADARRRRYLEKFVPPFLESLRGLAPDLNVRLDYRPGWPAESNFEQALVETRSRDVKLGATQAGPHRADLRLSAGTGSAAATVSRGQGKMIASAMRLAQARLIADATGQRSVFLIDDVGAELDEAHNQRLFRQLGGLECQVLATAARDLRLGGVFSGDRRMFHVEHGVCGPEKEA